MKPIKNWETVVPLGEIPKLPTGGYVLKIVKAYEKNDALTIEFDIAEGDYKDFYKKDFERVNSNLNNFWRGNHRLFLPTEKRSSDANTVTESRFKGSIQVIERCNPGYSWNWDEGSLVGKLVGGVFGTQVWESNGKIGTKTSCKKLISVEDVRNGNYTVPNPPPEKKEPVFAAAAEEEVLPF